MKAYRGVKAKGLCSECRKVFEPKWVKQSTCGNCLDGYLK